MSSSKYLITPTLDVPVFARIRFPAWLQSLYNIAQKECTTLDETGAFCLVALPTDWDTHVQNIINTAVAAVTAITAGVTTTIYHPCVQPSHNSTSPDATHYPACATSPNCHR